MYSQVFHVLVIVLFILFGLCRTAVAVTTTAANGLSCAGTRTSQNLGCTAGEFTTIFNITNAPGAPTSCVAGEYIFYNGSVSLSGTNADRYDIGFFTGESGNDPGLNNASNVCSVATFPTSPLPWLAKDVDACGDYQAAGGDTAIINNIKVLCAGNASGALMIPYTLVYSQNAGIICSGPANVQSGSTSKCNKGTAVVPVATFTVNGSVTVIKKTVPSGDSQSFAFTATGTGTVAAGDESFNLIHNGSKKVRMAISGTNRTLTITEANTPGWNSTAAITCTLPDGITPATFVTTNDSTRTITATLSNTNPNAICTITNTKLSIPIRIIDWREVY